MITANMDIDEVVHDVMQDMRWLQGWQQQNMSIMARDLLKQIDNGQRSCSVVKQLKSPYTKNDWSMLISIRAPKIIPLSMQWTTLQNDDGIYVYQAVPGDKTWIVIILTPHVFRRYRERLSLGDKLNTNQLIRRYMKNNYCGTFMPNGKHNDQPSWALCIEEGLILGKFVSDLCFFGSTFITHDLLYDGRQSKMAWEGEDRRQSLRPQYSSVRERMRMTRDTERITDNCEVEFNKKRL